jgi:ribose-phosphate pyrophosphokinase
MQPPADNLLELCFLLDALDKAGARINLFITYFSHARQLSLSAQQVGHVSIVSRMLQQFNLESLHIMHPHTNLLQNLLPHVVHIDMDFLQQQAAMYDAIVAPDKGAEDLVMTLATQSQKEVIRLSKVRLHHEHVSITSISGDVAGKRLLIVDDIIATGNTVMLAAHELKKQGALHVAVVATHGIFVPGAYAHIEKSVIDSVIVTNSLYQPYISSKIQIHDIGPYIAMVIQS